MARFRRIPIEVDAVQYVGLVEKGIQVRASSPPEWFAEAFTKSIIERSAMCDGICINTLEGVMTAKPGDWIVRGIKGELYPVKEAIFPELFEQIA